MITKWKLGNFKSVRSTTELPFASLTIFAGPNSSGKSSWIQSILMVAQTLAHRVGARSMVLNGVLARLGQFDDLRSFNSATKHIEVGWECSPRGEERLARSQSAISPLSPVRRRAAYLPLSSAELLSVSCDLFFDAEPSPERREPELTQLHPNLLRSSLTCVALAEEKETVSQVAVTRAQDWNLKESEFSVFLGSAEREAGTLRDSLHFNVDLDETSLEEVREDFPTATLKGCGLRHFIPERLTVCINAVEERARVVARFLQTGNARILRTSQFPEQDLVIPPGIVDVLRKTLVPRVLPSLPINISTEGLTVRDWTEALHPLSPVKRYNVQQELQKIPLQDLIGQEIGHSGQSDVALRSVSMPDELRDALSYVDFYFNTSISYLGPLRDEPKPVYPLPTSPDLTYVGLKGEFTAAVLDLHKYRYLDYIPSAQFVGSALEAKAENVSLNAAVSDWLQYLGVAESVNTIDQGKLGHELRVKTPGVPRVHDLTHAGVGVSQVLPILVTCLLARIDSTLLIEQPELHLHPSVQSRLGDFFLSMALLGKQCIIETHSEYLVNRLRLRIACAPEDNSLGNLTKIYFVEKHNDASTFTEVSVNEYGAIQSWPRGFFDESQNEAEEIIKAAATKRASRTARSRNDKRND